MADTNITHQAAHVTGTKYIPHQAVVLAQVKTLILKGNNSRRILAPVL